MARFLSPLVSLLRDWDTDGDGEVSKSEFQEAMPKLGIRAKWREVRALCLAPACRPACLAYSHLRAISHSSACALAVTSRRR